MTTYTIEAGDYVMGDYDGESPEQALDAYAMDAGYRDYAHLVAQVGGSATATETTGCHAALFAARYPDMVKLCEALDAALIPSDQDWDNETTTWTFEDGSKIQASGPSITVIEATQ